MHLSFTDTNTLSDGPRRDSTWHTSHRSTIGCILEISEPMVCSAQTFQLSCLKICTISTRTEMRFHLSLVTYEYHQVHPIRYLSLWYFCRKPCTYLGPALTLSSNGPKQDSTWPTWPRSSIGCDKNDFWAYSMFGANQPIFRAYGTFGANRAPILCQD
jgi:hypothetical protein